MKDETLAFRRIVRTRRRLKELGYDPEDVLGALDDLKQLREQSGQVARLQKAVTNAMDSLSNGRTEEGARILRECFWLGERQ